MFCPKCGTKAIDGAAFCQKCGATLVQDAEPAHTSAESEAIPPLKPVEGGSILSKTVPEKEQNNAPKITAPVQDDADKGKRSKKRGMGFIALILIAAVAAIVILGGKTKYPDELLYDGLPASRFLEMTREDIDLEFGQSGYVYQNQNRLTGDAYFNYEDIGIDHVTYSRETGKVIYVELWSHYCSFNGKKLDLTAKAALERVLSEGDFFGGPIEIYGSICSGFYYADAVYFSDTDDYVQWKQEQILDSNTTYIDRQMYTIDKHEDYKIGMITYTYDGHNSDEYEAQTFALYTDEWVNYVEEASMGGNIVTASDTTGVGIDTTDQVLLCGIPLNEVIGMQSSDVYANFGDPVDWVNDCMLYGVHNNEESTLFDEGWIEFNTYAYSVDSFSSDPINLTFDGQSLAQDFDALVTILGDDYILQGETTYSWWAAWYFDGYEISFEFPLDAAGLDSDSPFSVSVSQVT